MPTTSGNTNFARRSLTRATRVIAFLALPLLAFHFFIARPLQAGPWRLEKNEAGITVWVRDIAESDYREFSGRVIVKASLNSLVAQLDDISNHDKFMYLCVQARVLPNGQVDAENSKLSYFVINPPVIDPRDVVVRSTLLQDPTSKTVTVWIKAVPEGENAKPGMVRISKMEGFWQFAPRRDGTVLVTYRLYTEPGGNIPAWLANRLIVEMPFQTLSKFRERIPAYADRTVKGIQELNK